MRFRRPWSRSFRGTPGRRRCRSAGRLCLVWHSICAQNAEWLDRLRESGVIADPSLGAGLSIKPRSRVRTRARSRRSCLIRTCRSIFSSVIRGNLVLWLSHVDQSIVLVCVRSARRRHHHAERKNRDAIRLSTRDRCDGPTGCVRSLQLPPGHSDRCHGSGRRATTNTDLYLPGDQRIQPTFRGGQQIH